MKRLALIACLSLAACGAGQADVYTQYVFHKSCEPLTADFEIYAIQNIDVKGADKIFSRIIVEKLKSPASWCRAVRAQIVAEGRWL
jgi:hypothetical protein